MEYVAWETKDQWRVDRLKKAVKIAAKVLDLEIEQLELLLKEAMDSQGKLCLRWKHPPSNTLERAFRVAWSMCGEDENNVQHVVSW